MEKLEGIRLFFCDKKVILEIIVPVTESRNTQGQGWEESSCRNTSQESGSIFHDSLSGMEIFLRPEIKNFAQKRNQLFLVFPHPTPHWHWYPESYLVLPFSIRHVSPGAKQNLGLTFPLQDLDRYFALLFPSTFSI